MKIKVLFTALLFVGSEAFVGPQSARQTTALEGQKNSWMGPAAAATAALGWTLASQAAFAANVVPQSEIPSLTVAVEKLDFSLPSYEGIGANTGGFGVGSEAFLNPSNSDEKGKQEEAMRKAEEARVARKAANKQAKIQRNEDIIREAEQKKARDAQKLKSFVTGSY